MRQTLLQNATDIITKCDRKLLQNAPDFLLYNATVITNCDNFITNATFITNYGSTKVHYFDSYFKIVNQQ